MAASHLFSNKKNSKDPQHINFGKHTGAGPWWALPWASEVFRGRLEFSVDPLKFSTTSVAPVGVFHDRPGGTSRKRLENIT